MKLSHKEKDPQSGFQSYQFEGAKKEPQIRKEEPKKFELDEKFWQSLYSDPNIRKQLDFLIQKKVEERLSDELVTLKAKTIEEAKKQALEEAKKESEAKSQQTLLALETVAKELLEQKNTLLNAHAREWSDALSMLLKKFLVPNRKTSMEAIEEWLMTFLGEFANKGKIKIFLPEHFLDVKNFTQTKNIILEEKRDLNEGEILCEVEGGGIFFSTQEELKKLEDKISELNSKL
jgi:hypothetical protein